VATAEERDQLSPTPQAGAPVELPWELSWDDLRAAVPNLHQPVGAFRTHTIRGLHRVGGSHILTIRYADRDERRHTQTIFLKLTDPARPEIPKYRFLTAHQAPVAPLLGTATTAAGEILILEFLPTIGTTPDQADDLLELIAHLNSISNPPATAFRSLPGTPGYEDQIRRALIALLPPTGQAGRWIDAYRQATVTAGQVPLALNHNELSFQQVGWVAADEGGQRRLVVFDLETMSLRPRYIDIAGLLPFLASQTGRTEQELFGTYLKKLDRHTGEKSDLRLAWDTMRTLRIVRTFEALPWLISMTGTAGIEAPDRAIARLGRDLAESGLE
jgi:hypothetical protein